jgi:hypothetical protein
MKILAASALLLASALTQAQVKMTMTVNGMSVGKATLMQTITKAGQLHQTLHMDVDFQGMKSTFAGDLISDRNGRPLSDKSVETQSGQQKTVAMTYSATTLTIAETVGGKTTTKKVAIPKGNLADASTMWFIVTHPKIGAKSSYLHYDKASSKWQTKTATYLGDDAVPGTTKKAHHIHHEDGEGWIDDKGLPIRLELNDGGAKIILARQ